MSLGEGGGGGEIPKGGCAGRARSLGIWPPGGRDPWGFGPGGRDHGGAKSLGHRIRPSTRFQIVCGFKNSHSGERIQKVAGSHANSPDTCGQKANPERKSCGFKNIRIRVDERRIRKKKLRIQEYPDTCGRKANPERKSCGLKNIRIRVDGA